VAYGSGENQKGTVRAQSGPEKGTQRYIYKSIDKSIDNIYCASVSEDATKTTQEVWVSTKKRKLEGKPLEAFKQFWDVFGYPKGRANAIDAWLDIPDMTATMVRDIVGAAKRTANERPILVEKKLTPIYAQGWLSQRRWEDQTHETNTPGPACSTGRPPSRAEGTYNKNQPAIRPNSPYSGTLGNDDLFDVPT
jgi:hypothetical protein